ncbi:unnamed protein product, partial [Brugia timori]|uniref:Ovule protein n=1 Tax=Brugia timori TaxID=42155 RepID=A0A0R3QCZ3_9BILA
TFILIISFSLDDTITELAVAVSTAKPTRFHFKELGYTSGVCYVIID